MTESYLLPMDGTEKRVDGEWMRIGAFAASGAALLLLILRRPRPARLALGFAFAFLSGLRDARLSAHVHEMLARSGNDA